MTLLAALQLDTGGFVCLSDRRCVTRETREQRSEGPSSGEYDGAKWMTVPGALSLLWGWAGSDAVGNHMGQYVETGAVTWEPCSTLWRRTSV